MIRSLGWIIFLVIVYPQNFGAANLEFSTPLVPSNFYSVLSREAVMLVVFTAPWCPHCRDLYPEIEEAAAELESLGIPVGHVDASEHRSLAGDAGVLGVPWFKLYFSGGDAVDYEGPRDSIGLVAAVRAEAQDRGIEIAASAKPKCGAMDAAQDRVGNGGHGGSCTGKGQVSFGLCKQKLIDSKECSALTYKKGTCYLHDRTMDDHWTDRENGGMYVVKMTRGIDRCD